MKSVNVNLQIDEDIKKQADKLFDDLGMNLSTAFSIFLKQSIREQGIPFMVSMHVPNETTIAAIEAAERGEDLYGPFDSAESLMEALNAES